MILTFRPIDQRPPEWDDGRTRPWSPFRATYQATLRVLERELDMLRARDAFLQVEASHRDVRLDGQLRADAKVGHPGVILTVDSARHGTLVYPCYAFSGGYRQPGWQANLRAVALGLEALRKVERYGIADRGQQYAGFGALPPARAMGAAMTFEEAAAFLVEHAYGPDIDPQEAIDNLDEAYRLAAKQLHPDAGGDPALFRRLAEARDLLRHG